MAPGSGKVVIDLLDSDSDDAPPAPPKSKPIKPISDKVTSKSSTTTNKTKPPPPKTTSASNSKSSGNGSKSNSKSSLPPKFSSKPKTTSILEDDPITSQPFSSSPNFDINRNASTKSQRKPAHDLISLSSGSSDNEVEASSRTKVTSASHRRTVTGNTIHTTTTAATAATRAKRPPTRHKDIISSDNELEDLDSLLGSQTGQTSLTRQESTASNIFDGLGFSPKTLELLASLEDAKQARKSPEPRRISSIGGNFAKSKATYVNNTENIFDGDDDEQDGHDDIDHRTKDESLSKAYKAQEKANKKRQREEEQANKKKQREEERASNKRLREEEQAITSVNKLKQSHTQTVTEMIVDVSSTLFDAPVCERLQSFFDSLGAEYESCRTEVPDIVTWRRKVSSIWNDELGIFMPGPETVKSEEFVLCLITATDFVPLAADDSLLDGHVRQLKSAFPGYKVIYLVEGLTKYIKKKQTEQNRAFTAAVRKGLDGTSNSSSSRSRSKKDNNAVVLDVDSLEDALLRLQVVHSCLVFQSVNYMDSAEVISSYTQHISAAPYKKARQNISRSTNFCMDVGQVKSGSNREDIYGRMLQEVQLCTAGVASTIQGAFPTVPRLYSAFQTQGEDMLKTLAVVNNKTGLSTGRALGPAMSRKMAKVWTCTDEWALES